ncbi:MAG: 4a-hydroxytetrahydrobiopterin dehydratase [Saonia sp.]
MKKFTEIEIKKHLEAINGWEYTDDAIQKSFKFNNFRDTFAIMTRIAFECEAQNHHPEWSNVYNSLTIRLNTHDADGITQNDFDLAKIIEEIVNKS